MKFCFDLDNTLCVGKPYQFAVPVPGALELLEELHENGHEIVIYTARGMDTHKGNVAKVLTDYAMLTLKQLESWGFPYDEIYFGKPSADIYIDDKAVTALGIEQIRGTIESLLEENRRGLVLQEKCSAAINSLDQLLGDSYGEGE